MWVENNRLKKEREEKGSEGKGREGKGREGNWRLKTIGLIQGARKVE